MWKGAGRFQSSMLLYREPCVFHQPDELSRRLPRVIQTYSKKSNSPTRFFPKDSLSISTALPKEVHDEKSAPTSDPRNLRAAGVSSKEDVSKPIRLLLRPKQVISLVKKHVCSKTKIMKDRQTRRKPKRHRRASVHEILQLKSHKEYPSDIEVSAVL